MITNIRKPGAQDLNYILDIDLKCFEDTWPHTKWRETVRDPNYGMLIGTYQGLPVGFIVWSNDGVIARLAVKPTYRNKGVGSQLLAAVEVIFSQQTILEVKFPITESLCQPGVSYDMSHWLTNRGYRANGLIKGAGWFSDTKEDQIKFHKFLEGSTKHG